MHRLVRINREDGAKPLRFNCKRLAPRGPKPEALQPHQKNLARPSAEEIYEQVANNARQQLKRTSPSLALSGFGGGAFMEPSALCPALVPSMRGDSNTVQVVSRPFHPLRFIVGLGNFAHCVATSGEVLVAVLAHRAPWIAYPTWLFPAVMGNICGGVGLVTILEYGQVIYGGDAESRRTAGPTE